MNHSQNGNTERNGNDQAGDTKLTKPEGRPKDARIAALRRFAVGITALNIAGHLFFGFEPSWAQFVLAITAAWGIDASFELIDAWAHRRTTVFRSGLKSSVNFLLPAHITGNAVAMLLYGNNRLAPVFLAVAVGLGAKRVIRVRIGDRRRHFFNPSNIGIVFVLLVFPSVGIAPPYQFTHYLLGAWAIVLPVVLLGPAIMVTVQLTKKVPLIMSWLAVFVVQALVRSILFGFPFVVGLVPMTGTVFVLFTFYMMADPGTTPVSTLGQITFGAAVAVVYGILIVAHVVFGLFFSLAIVCFLRGIILLWRSLRPGQEAPHAERVEIPGPIPLRVPEASSV